MTAAQTTATVLAVDDSPITLEVLAVRLKCEDVRLVTATTWAEGYELAHRVRPDVILLDIELNDASGLDLCRRLKAHPDTAPIPVIFLTANADSGTKVHGFDLGAADYITKPFDPPELRARVRAAIRAKRAYESLARTAAVDARTGLSNREFFDERLAVEVGSGSRDGRDLSVVLLGLDPFDPIADGGGQPPGERVLESIGVLLARSLRPTDLACRFGPEELGIILPGASVEAARVVVDRLREQLRDLSFTGPHGEPVSVSASFGVASASDVARTAGDVSAQVLVAAADEALEAAKLVGRDAVRVFAAEGRLTDISALRRAG